MTDPATERKKKKEEKGKAPTVDVPAVDVAKPEVPSESVWVPRDTFSALLDPVEYRDAKTFAHFLVTPELKNGLVGEARGRSYVIDSCVGYFHYQKDLPGSAFDNAVGLARSRKQAIVILVDPEKNRVLCSIAPELFYSEIRLRDDVSTPYAGATALQKRNGYFIGDRRIEAVLTADGFGLLPYQEPLDILAGRIGYRSVGNEAATRVALTLAAAAAAVARSEPKPSPGLDVYLEFELDLGTGQSLPFPQDARVEMMGLGADGAPRVLASNTAGVSGAVQFHIVDRNALGDVFKEVSFVLTFGESPPYDVPPGFRWESRGATAADGVVPGLLRNPGGIAYGSEQVPIRFLVKIPAAKRRKSLPLELSAVTDVELTPFGRRSEGSVKCTNDWTFEYAKKAANSDEVLAVFGGRLHSIVEAGKGVHLVLTAADPSLLAPEGRLDWPAWFPKCVVLTYSSLDPDAVREIVERLLQRPDFLHAVIRDNPPLAGVSTDELAARFVLGDFAVDVPAGSSIARGAALPSGHYGFSVSAKEQPSDAFNVNLAHSVAEWASSGELPLSKVPPTLAESLTKTTGIVIASGNVHLPANGAELAALLQSGAKEGDWIVLAAGGDYALPSAVQIAKPVVVSADGDSTAASPSIRGSKPPAEDRNNPTWAQQAHQVFVVNGVEGGLVQLKGIHFRDSAARQGGAIEVNSCDRVLIEDCLFTGNEAYAGGWLYEGFGGAVCARHASIWVRRCTFRKNAANCRGGAIGIFGYAWPIVTDCRFENNDVRTLGVLNVVTGQPFFARADGGAIGIQTAAPSNEGAFGRIAALAPAFENVVDGTQAMAILGGMVFDGKVSLEDAGILKGLNAGDIEQFWDQTRVEEARKRRMVLRDCIFIGNTAQDDGGGLYATGLARASCSGLYFEKNRAGANGGGFRISTACDFNVSSSEVRDNASNADLDGFVYSKKKKDWIWTTDAGGGIASRTSNLRLFEVRILNNKANRFAGGGIYFTSTDDGALQGAPPFIKTDWNLIRGFLIRDFAAADNSAVSEYRAFTLEVSGCTLQGNQCGWCGGSEARPGPRPGPGGAVAPAGLKVEDTDHAKGGGVYVLRFFDDKKGGAFPPLEVRLQAGTVLADNTAAFSKEARHLYIADLTVPVPNNPVRDSRHLQITSTGVLTAAFHYP